RVACTAVIDRDVESSAFRLERVEERPRAVSQDALRPPGGDGGVAAELLEVDRSSHCEVVIPTQADISTFPNDLAALVGPWAVAHDVAEAPELVRRRRVDGGEHRLERGEVRVHVRDDPDPHPPKLVRREPGPLPGRSTSRRAATPKRRPRGPSPPPRAAAPTRRHRAARARRGRASPSSPSRTSHPASAGWTGVRRRTARS